MFATKGFMLAMHVPSFLAKDKNKLARALYRIGKSRVDIKQEWSFLNELKNIITTFRQEDASIDTQTITKTETENEQNQQLEFQKNRKTRQLVMMMNNRILFVFSK